MYLQAHATAQRLQALMLRMHALAEKKLLQQVQAGPRAAWDEAALQQGTSSDTYQQTMAP